MKHTMKMIAHFSRNFDGDISYELYTCDMSQYGSTPICAVDVEFETPDDFNHVSAEIEILRKQKQKIQAEAQIKANEIDDQIAKLSCLEYRP